MLCIRPRQRCRICRQNKKTFTDLIATLFDGGIRDYNYVKNTLLEISDNDKSNISKKEEYDWLYQLNQKIGSTQTQPQIALVEVLTFLRIMAVTIWNGRRL